MDNLLIKEKLNSIRNEMTHLWGASFIIGGGALTLLINNNSIKGVCFACFGIVIAAMFLNAYFLRRDELCKILNTLEVS